MRTLPALVLALALAAALASCERASRDAAEEPLPPVEAGAPEEEEPAGEGAPGEPPEARPIAGAAREGCDGLPSASDLRRMLREAPGAGEAGGLAGGRMMWAALVDRSGRLCAVVVSTDDPTAAWPGSRAIAMAKAYTANAFSTDAQPLSTARLYTMSQPGHSLWGLPAANPFDPDCLDEPAEPDEHTGEVCGGTIVFGGGLALYRDERRIGGLGVSGDTSCTDHEIAKRVRAAAGLEPPGGAAADDIQYASVDGASAFTHPLCANTFRDGQQIGAEAPAQGY
jgi:uncharacterized protein GlcG (DUF336 family)